MSNFLADIGDLTGNSTFTDLSQNGTLNSVGNFLVQSVAKQPTPVPSPVTSVAPTQSAAVSVSNPKGSKILYYVGGAMALLVGIYFYKKNKR
jgi:hypothetical protein